MEDFARVVFPNEQSHRAIDVATSLSGHNDPDLVVVGSDHRALVRERRSLEPRGPAQVDFAGTRGTGTPSTCRLTVVLAPLLVVVVLAPLLVVVVLAPSLVVVVLTPRWWSSSSSPRWWSSSSSPEGVRGGGSSLVRARRLLVLLTDGSAPSSASLDW